MLKATTNMTFESAAAASLALQPDAPLFCFSGPQLHERAQVFLKGFPGEVTFAVKANSSSQVIKGLADAGIKAWDVASVHEMAMVSKIVPKARFHYHNPVKSRREITDAYKIHKCRRYVVDCREELAKIADSIGPAKDIEIAVRLVLPRERASSAHDFSTKFGAPDHICVELLKRVVALGYSPLLTFHQLDNLSSDRKQALAAKLGVQITSSSIEVVLGKLICRSDDFVMDDIRR